MLFCMPERVCSVRFAGHIGRVGRAGCAGPEEVVRFVAPSMLEAVEGRIWFQERWRRWDMISYVLLYMLNGLEG